MSEDDNSEDVVYQTFVENGNHRLGMYVFDNVDEAKQCVEEFIDMKYDLETGIWTEDSYTGNYTLETEPDEFRAGVLVHDVHSDRDSALGGMRKQYSEAVA